MKKLILAFVVSAFGVSTFGAASAYACDGMKDHAKGDKSDTQNPSATSGAKKDGKSGKSDQKS